MNPNRCDAVLLIGFGGPTRREEVRPFLARVLHGQRVPAERIEEVARHYEELGGASPYNALTFRQADAVRNALDQTGWRVPIYTGMRHWHPLLTDVLEQMAKDGVRRALAVILAPHQGEASWGRCQTAVNKAQTELRVRLQTEGPNLKYAEPWFAHPGFVGAIADRIREALVPVPESNHANLPVLFTSHSVPVSMAEPYVAQLQMTCSAVARKAALANWKLVYQSRSGNPADPWLEPDVCDAIRSLAREGHRDVLLAPVGFICDHVEVLYDLDRQARQAAADCGLGFFRASTVNDHPGFIRALADVIARGCSE
jgi:ferrochelatase